MTRDRDVRERERDEKEIVRLEERKIARLLDERRREGENVREGSR